MRRFLLGPQRLEPILGETVERLGIDGPIALVTAGWEENERDDEVLREELGRPGPNLALYQRSERVFERDPTLLAAHRERRERLRELLRLYRRRLDHALDAYRELRGLAGEGELLAQERDAALEAVRDLDRHQLQRVLAIRADFEQRSRLPERPAVARERAELERQLDSVVAVAIAGGHVAVLLDLMRLFGLAPLLEKRPLIAWSAGAMALGERIVLFHDSPPWGAGNAESLDYGLALCPGLLPLPHARRRLRLEDPDRVALLARRFAPLLCIGLDEGSRLACGEESWSAERVRVLGPGGAVTSPAKLAIPTPVAEDPEP